MRVANPADRDVVSLNLQFCHVPWASPRRKRYHHDQY